MRPCANFRCEKSKSFTCSKNCEVTVSCSGESITVSVTGCSGSWKLTREAAELRGGLTMVSTESNQSPARQERGHSEVGHIVSRTMICVLCLEAEARIPAGDCSPSTSTWSRHLSQRWSAQPGSHLSRVEPPARRPLPGCEFTSGADSSPHIATHSEHCLARA